MNRLLPIALSASLALLAGCGGEEHRDLKQELAQLTKDFRGQVPPLPQVKPYEPVPYTSEGQVDPFRSERIEVAQGSRHSAGQSKLAEHEKRVKEPLEAFPLESIQMLGTISQEKETFARRSPDQAEGAGPGRHRRMGGARERPATRGSTSQMRRRPLV